MSDGDARDPKSRSAAGELVDAELGTLTRTDLLQIARARELPDVDLMGRDELIAVLRKTSPSQPPAAGSPTMSRAEPLPPESAMPRSHGLENLSRVELLELARSRNVPGAVDMSRIELIAALQDEPVIRPPTPGPRSTTPAPMPVAVWAEPASAAARPGKDTNGRPRLPSRTPSGNGTAGGRKEAVRNSLPPKRAFIPGAIVCLALLGLGLVAGSKVGGTAGAMTQTSVYTTTISGRIVTVEGKPRRIIVPATTIRRNGHTITIPTHTVAITDTQVVTGPTRTVDGTVIRTVRVPVTVTGPGRTDTTTQTVTGPVTTVVQTVVTTVIDTITDTVTETVTTPPAS
jgi:hypothetical protein